MAILGVSSIPEKADDWIFAGIVRKLHQPRARLLVGAGLVEPELPLLADADNHQIDVVDRPVVGFAVTRDARFGHRPVGEYGCFRAGYRYG